MRRPVWLAPLFLLVLASLAAALVPLLPSMKSAYAGVLARLTDTQATILREGGTLSFRPIFAALLLCLSLFAAGPVRQRVKLLVYGWTLYGLTVVTIDVIMVKGGPLTPDALSEVGGIVAGFGGFLVMVLLIFTQFHLPSGVRVRTERRLPRGQVVNLVMALAGATGVVVTFSLLRSQYFEDFHITYVGGLDSEIVLFLLSLVCILSYLSMKERLRRPTSGPCLPVAFLIPAYNEAHGIGECIAALDEAAGWYGGPCRAYVVDNGSQDGTRSVAAEALRWCTNVTGEVLECPRPGKSHALNFGLSRITEEITVRIDADTIVAPSILPMMISWFWDPSVGGVSGVPLPKASTVPWLYPLRVIEVCYGVMFLRVAQGAANAVMVMPGLIAGYRTSVVRQLGGFGEGFNGEDADITMRIGRLGYRIVTDPDVRVFTEVPQTLSHLREQRQRWARGLFHMARRNLSSIGMRQGPRGVVVLPWSILNASRRSMMIPILLCALVVEVLDPSVFSLREVSVLAGFIVGLQAIVICLLLVAQRQFKILPFVPVYLVFRLFRAYVAFETVLTLLLKPPSPRRRMVMGRQADDGGTPAQSANSATTEERGDARPEPTPTPQQSPALTRLSSSTATDPVVPVTFSQ